MVTAALSKRLLRLIKATRGQFLAAVLIITVGIFTYTALTNASINLDQTLNDYYSDTHFADVFITTAPVDQSQADRLAHEMGVTAVQSRLQLEAPVLTEDCEERITVRVISTAKGGDTLNQLHLQSGQLTLKNGELLVLEQFAQGRGLSVGDTLHLQINGRDQPFLVAGIVSSAEFVYLMKDAQTLLPDPERFGVVYVDLDYLQQISGRPGAVNNILLTLKEPAAADDFIDRLKEESHLPLLFVSDRTEQLSHSMIRQEIDSLQKVSSSLPAVFLIFAAMMLVSVLSRTIKGDRASIGVLKAIGYSEWEIMGHYVLYALAAGLLGGLLGNLIGLSLAGILTRFYLLYFHMPAYTVKLYAGRVALALLGTCLLSIASGIFGSRAVLRITPADAMRPEPPRQGRHIWLDQHWPAFWKRLSFSAKMILRSLAREKKKAALIICGVAMTCGMLMVSFWYSDIFHTMAYRHFEETMTMDYTLTLADFRDYSAVRELTQLEGVDACEGFLALPCEMTLGPRTKTATLTGIIPDTCFYRLEDKSGRLIALDNDGIVISSNLAKSLGAQPGDILTVKNLQSDSRKTDMVLAAVNEQLLGQGAYIRLDTLGQKLADKNIVNGFYIRSHADLDAEFREMKALSAVTSKAEMQKMYISFTSMVMASVVVLVLFSGLLGGAIIYSTTIMSIRERTGEFSSLRVLGYSQKEIFSLLWGENMLLALMGILAGLPLGWGLVKLMALNFTTDLYTLNEPLSLSSLLLALASTLAFVLLAQLITYRRIVRMDFIQALKTRIS